MMAGMTALPLQQLIASLDNTCLPKILQVCSGVYFQGSVYEISGSEVCFSTGDLIKVTGIELLSVCCEDTSTNEKFELPINHKGLFKIVPEKMPYNTVEEMMSLRPLSLESSLPFTFTCDSRLTFDNFTLSPGITLTVLSTEQREGEEDKLRCQVQGQRDASAEVLIPLSSHGEFRECETEERFTLREIMASPFLSSRRFFMINTTKCECPLVLTPIYQVHAVMSLRKNVLKFPSSLEVDVVDITEQCEDMTFEMPLSLTEVFSLPSESFPVMVHMLERPETRSLFKCSWLPELRQTKDLVFHKTQTSTMVLLSSLKSRKAQQYFLVSHQYGGRFRRQPREFNSVYELYVASLHAQGLRVTVARNSEEVEEEGLPALSVGEQLEVGHCVKMQVPGGSNNKQNQSIDALLCQHVHEPDDGDDDDDNGEIKHEDQQEKVFLPLYMQGHFLEVLPDNKKCRLKDLGTDFKSPLNVKAVSRDSELQTDPLVGFPCLKIEGAQLEPTILASFPHKPDHCFEIPTQWVSMSVSLTKDPLPWPSGDPPKCHIERVTEVTDEFFYKYTVRQNSGAAPPPRPPKKNQSSSKSCKKISKPTKKQKKSIPTQELANLTLNSKRRPAPPPPAIADDQMAATVPHKQSVAERSSCKALPNTYTKLKGSEKKVLECNLPVDVDSDHDYEYVDDLMTVIEKAQEHAKFY